MRRSRSKQGFVSCLPDSEPIGHRETAKALMGSNGLAVVGVSCGSAQRVSRAEFGEYFTRTAHDFVARLHTARTPGCQTEGQR